jgi:hypothetical protein
MLTNNEETLASITSFDDALALLKGSGIDVHSTEEFGDGFSVVEDKNTLVGAEFVTLGMKFSTGDHGEFVIIHAVTKDGRKVIITDGSTGIFAQATKYASKGLTAGLRVPRGLIRSDFRYIDGVGVVKPGDAGYDSKEAKTATTYYLS